MPTLESIYQDDINRYINPAVAVGELKEDYIDQEINEYIFTSEIIVALYKFLNALINKEEGKPGIWIDGYYGSGKSHFIKYAFYCLNRNTRKQALQNFKEAIKEAEDLDLESGATLSNVANLEKKLEQMELDEVMFNIDYVSKQSKNQNTITRILFNQFNKKRGYNSSNIALARLIEKKLDQVGKFDDFKVRIKEIFKGEEWVDEKINDFIEAGLSEVIEIAAELLPNIDRESLHHSILNEREYTIEEFTNELKEFLKTKDENYRLVFLLDEVSQYIGRNTSLLLNLQTIIVGLGAATVNKVWLVCTAQQELGDLKDHTEDKTVDFGKIMGRFETKISLESQDAALITQKRVLDKNAESLELLGNYYKENEQALKNQFQFDHQLYKNYQNVDDFYLAYPFIPYQFRLISDVFKSFADIGFVTEGIKNTERSILGITHLTAKNIKDKKVGYFVSFDNFFNEQIREGLTQNARSILDRAYKIEFKSDQKDFATKVIRVLFMISNLDDSLKINFPSTVENIAFLLIDDVSVIKSDLYKDVQNVLDYLVDQNIIQSSEGTYRFLDNDGIRFANIVKNAKVSPNARAKYFYDLFIMKYLSPRQDVDLGNRRVRASLWIDDKQETREGDFDIKFIAFDQTDIQQRAMAIPANELNININEWLQNDQNFKKDFLEYCKTLEAIRDHKPNATGDRVKTIEKFVQVNQKLLKDLQTRFEKNFVLSSFTSKQQVIAADKIKTTQPKARYEEMLNNHLEQIYKNHNWSDQYAKTNTELQEAIQKSLRKPSQKEELNLAEKEIEAKINQSGGEMNLSEVVKLFEKPPYGWRDLATLEMVFHIVHKKHRDLTAFNEELELKDYYDKAINTALRSSIEIKPIREYDKEEVDRFSEALQNIFPDYSLPPNKEISHLINDFKEGYLRPQLEKAHQLKDNNQGYPFTDKIRDYHLSLANIWETKSVDKLMGIVNKQQEQLKKERDFFVGISDFIQQFLGKYEDLRNFVDNEQANFESLEEDLQENVNKIKSYLNYETEPAVHLPPMLKLQREIKKAIQERLTDLKGMVIDQYKTAFDELYTKQKELKLDEANLIPDKNHFINKLENSKSLKVLELAEAKLDAFKQENLFTLQEEAQKQKAAEKGEKYSNNLIEYSLSKKYIGEVLSTPEEVDAFINKLRKELMLELGKNKDGKIFLQ